MSYTYTLKVIIMNRKVDDTVILIHAELTQIVSRCQKQLKDSSNGLQMTWFFNKRLNTFGLIRWLFMYGNIYKGNNSYII